jgi:hypothetical protein
MSDRKMLLTVAECGDRTVVLECCFIDKLSKL